MIELPPEVVPNNAEPSLMDFGGVMKPATGGKALRVDRLGNRFKATISLPPMENKANGRVVVSRLIRAKSEGIRIEYPLCGVDQGSPGSPRVNGADQAGTEIALKGFRPGYGCGEGYWLSIETDGQHYLYNAAAPATADGAGELTLTIYPPLRAEPADNDIVHLQRPMIEGLVMGEEQGWNISLAHHVSIMFEIEESE